MKKRLLSAFMALALCLTLLPAPAWAAETENNIAVQANTANVAEVTINGTTTQYADIVAAFDAAQLEASATVKLLENVTIPKNESGYSYGIRLKSGNITLDLNGCTIQTTGGTSGFVPLDAVFYIEDGSSLTVQDKSTNGGGKIVQPNGGQAIHVGFNGTLTVESGAIEVTSTNESRPGPVIMDKNCAVFLTGGGTANILGGTLTGKQGIYVKNGSLNVSGGTIRGNGSYALWVAENAVTTNESKVQLSGGSYTTSVENGCSIWNADGTAAALLASGCRFESEGKESAYSKDGKGVVGNTTVAPRPANEYAYIGKDGTAQTQANCTEITNRTDNISTPGWYVVKENVTISGLNISGEVNLILCDGATLTVTSLMNVAAGSTLNLFWQSAGSGKLTAAAISVPGTVTAPAGEMKQTTGEGGTTFEKCLTHEWGYTVNEDDTHTATCKLCGKAEAAESHKYDSWAPTDANTHTGTCACGATKTEDHTLTCTPNADGLTHSTKCSVCGYTAAVERHNFDQTDGYGKKCACGAYLAAEYNGQQYATLARAIEAAKDGGTVTLARDVSENATVTGGTLTVDLNRKTWLADISKNLDIWGRIPLTVTGGSVTLENGTLDQGRTTSAGSYGIRIQGGSVTVKGNAVVIGSNTTGSEANISYPAIRLESGDLTLETGATLVHGLKVPEGKHLSDYLPEGTAFGLRGYDESTKTLTVDKGLFADAYTTNVYNIPNMALVVVEHKHTFAAGTTNCECGFTCAQHDWSKKNGVCTVCGSACPHNAGATETNGLYACDVCGQTVTAKVVAPDGSTTTYYADGYVNNNVKSGLYFAIKAAKTGSTVTALGGGKPAGGYVKNRKSLTLDVSNGKTIDGILNVGYTNTGDTGDTGNTLIVIGSAEISYVIVEPKNTLDLTGWTGRIGSLTVQNGGKATLNGGTFTTLYINGATAGSLLAEGYAFQNAGTGAYVEYSSTADMENVKVVKCPHSGVTLKEDHTGAECKYCGASFAATLDDAPYGTIDAAVTDWLANGGTLKLYADYTAADGTWKVGSGSHTINLNGHRMSVQGDGSAFFKPANNMHLTVTDSKGLGQITNILLDGNQNGSFTLESGYVHNLKMTGGAVVTLEGGRVDNLDVKNCSENTNLSIQGGSLGKLNIEDWADGMNVSATGGSIVAYTLPRGKILADVLDHQYYAEGTSLDKWVDAAQPVEKFVIKQAPHDFGSTSKTADVPINGSIPFMVGSPSENVGVYDVKWYRRTNSGAEHMTENKVAGVNVNDTLDVFCVITGLDRPNNGTVLWQVAVKGYTIKVVPAKLNGDRTVITQKPNTGNTGNPADNRLVVTPFSSSTFNDVEYKFEVTYNRQPLELNKDYTIKDSSNRARNAGTHTLTIEGKGNYTGEKSVTWTLEPYELSVGNFRHAQINKAYDGTDAVTDSTNGINGLAGFMLDSKNPRNPILSTVNVFYLGKSDYQLSNMKFDSAEAGDRTFTGTMTLTPDGNFVFADGSRVMQIEYGSSGLVSVSINRASIAAPAAKALQVANNHAATYTVDLSALLPALEAPRKYGAVTYGAPTVNLSSDYYTSGAKVEDGKLILPIQAVETSTESNIGTVTVKVTSGNIVDFDLTINVNATNKIVPTGEPTLSTETLTYGQALSAIKLSGKLHDNVNNKDVEGMFTWVDGTVKPNAGSYEAAWKFTPTDGGTYAETTGTVSITVNKAKPTGDPTYTKITAANKTLKDAALKPNASWPSGTVQWVDKDGKPLPAATQVQANTEYTWSFTPADTANYNGATGELTLYSVSTGGGGGSSSGSTVKTDTVTNPDGSVTKTETKKDGTKVETTTGKDGSTTKTETKKDGSSVTESKAADGSTGTVKTDKNGQTTAETALSSKAIETAKRNGEPVKAPVEVKATRNSNTAPTVKIELPKNSGDTKVEIPVTNVKPGTVAVIVHPDGTEEIVKNSLPTEDGIQLTINGGATVKIVDNSKDFIDTRNHWAKDAIDFVSARGLVNGMSATIYAPNASTTRAQLWTILARQNDADLNGGATWFENAQNWAKAKGISDGANPNAAINRAQMVTMLWRAMGQPAAASGASFADVPADSYYAQAVAWAIENGITAGVGGGRFDPNSTCTRAQIVTFLYRSYQSK